MLRAHQYSFQWIRRAIKPKTINDQAFSSLSFCVVQKKVDLTKGLNFTPMVKHFANLSVSLVHVVLMLVSKNVEYMKRKTAPSCQPIFSFDKKYDKKTLATNENMIKLVKIAISTLKGAATNVTPKIRVIFMKQLPTMLPNARSA